MAGYEHSFEAHEVSTAIWDDQAGVEEFAI